MIGIIVAEEKELLAVKEVMDSIEEVTIYEKIWPSIYNAFFD